ALTTKWVAAAALTAIALLVPVMLGVTVSVAVIVWLPAVFNVALNVPVPFVSVESAGSVAAPSVPVKWTVPAYPVERLLNGSSAVTVKLNALPAIVDPGAVTLKCVAAAGRTTNGILVPVILGFRSAVAVTVWFPAVLRI